MANKAWVDKQYPLTSLEMVGDHIIIVYFDNPPVNTSTLERMVAWNELFYNIGDDDDIRCVIISGKDTEYNGKHYFSGGADVKQWNKSDQGVKKVGQKYRPMIFPHEAKELENIFWCGKPSIAMVNGTAVGMGADWAIAPDITIASDDAKIGWVYVHRGIIPADGGTWLLPRRIGVNRAMELLLTGKIIDAQEAYRLGIFNKVVPHNELRDATLEYANWFVKGPPLAFGATRALVYQGLDMSFHEHLKSLMFARACVIPDRQEAMAAWVEKREPKYQGKGVPGR